ncbi:ankyrin repeat domain-containing protein [Candidatus Tisiphia endosymbiont of Nemotelus uliginosus]|uniref:ankyrin repeat domain-containing protein n=1 Tax=Candidatus Tisiphia endosymbiont of Nemotelus uliginosus TaxID=3077926 RepID=UPI0035C892F4
MSKDKAFDLEIMVPIMNKYAIDKEGNTILHFAAQEEMVNLLESFSLYFFHQPDSKNFAGSTPLHLAAARGNVNAISILHKKGAHLDAPDHQGHTPLHSAVLKGQIKALETLLKLKPDLIDIPNQKGITALMVATHHKDIEAVKTLAKLTSNIDSPTPDGFTTCMMATLQGDDKMLQILIKELGANINASTNHGLNALQIAQSKGNTNIVKTLRALGAKANDTKQDNITVATIPKNQDSNQPIPKAAQPISESAQINVKSQVRSPTNSDINQEIYRAAMRGNVNQLQGLLTKEGIDPNAKFNQTNNNALHVARKKTNVIDQLIAFGFPLNAQNSQEQTTLAVIIRNQDEQRVLPNIMKRVEQAPADKQPSILLETIEAVKQTQYPDYNSDEYHVVQQILNTLSKELTQRLPSVNQSRKRSATDNLPISPNNQSFIPSPTPPVVTSPKKLKRGNNI